METSPRRKLKDKKKRFETSSSSSVKVLAVVFNIPFRTNICFILLRTALKSLFQAEPSSLEGNADPLTKLVLQAIIAFAKEMIMSLECEFPISEHGWNTPKLR